MKQKICFALILCVSTAPPIHFDFTHYDFTQCFSSVPTIPCITFFVYSFWKTVVQVHATCTLLLTSSLHINRPVTDILLCNVTSGYTVSHYSGFHAIPLSDWQQNIQLKVQGHVPDWPQQRPNIADESLGGMWGWLTTSLATKCLRHKTYCVKTASFSD